MALLYAPFCSRCGTHRTRHLSGICCHCRRRPPSRSLCTICGIESTNHESGICYKCRKVSKHYSNKLIGVLEYQKKVVTVLELRAIGKSFEEIGHEVGLSKSGVYSIYCKALDLPEWSEFHQS